MERVVRHFQEELEALQSRLLAMGGLAEERVRAAVHGLVSRDVMLRRLRIESRYTSSQSPTDSRTRLPARSASGANRAISC